METEIIAVKKKTILDLFTKHKPTIQQIIPPEITPERLMQIALTEIYKNPALLNCEPVSLVKSVIQGMSLGLEFGGVLGEAYLIPYAGKAQFQPGYKGLIKLAHRSGKIKHVLARIVWEKEHFSYQEGLESVLEHTPRPPAERGVNRTACYAIFILTDGTKVFELMWADEITKIRDGSQSYKKDLRLIAKKEKDQNKFSAWTNHPDMMWRKTVLIRQAKTTPLSTEYRRATELSEAGEMGRSQREFTFHDEDLITDDPKPTMEPPKSKSETPTPKTDEEKKKGNVTAIQIKAKQLYEGATSIVQHKEVAKLLGMSELESYNDLSLEETTKAVKLLNAELKK